METGLAHTHQASKVRRLHKMHNNGDICSNLRELTIEHFDTTNKEGATFFSLPLLAALEDVVRKASLRALSLREVHIRPHLIKAIAASKMLRRLELKHCTTNLGLDTPGQPTDPLSITSLSMIYGEGSTTSMTSVLPLCPALCSLLLAGSLEDVPEADTTLPNLQYFNVDDIPPNIGLLLHWSKLYSNSNLTRLKIATSSGIPQEQLQLLLSLFTNLKDTLRVLVLDGLLRISVDFVESLATSVPYLRGLTLLGRENINERRGRLVDWPQPIHMYAGPLSQLLHLEHFGANFRWSRMNYSPMCLEDLLTAEVELTYRDEPTEGHTTNILERNLDADQQDSTSSAFDLICPFAVACPSLRTFHLTQNSVVMSCSVRHYETGGRVSWCITDEQYHSSDSFSTFETVQDSWNPRSLCPWFI